MLLTFIHRCFLFATDRTFHRLDAWLIFVSTAISIFFWAKATPMPEKVVVDAAVYVGLAVAFVFFLRLLVSPFFVWKKAETARLALESAASMVTVPSWTDRDTRELVEKELVKQRIAVAAELYDLGRQMLPFRMTKWRDMRSIVERVLENCRPFVVDERINSLVFEIRFGLDFAWQYNHATETNISEYQRNHIANSFNIRANQAAKAAHDILLASPHQSRSLDILDDPRNKNPFDEWTAKKMTATYADGDEPDHVTIYLPDELLWKEENVPPLHC